MEEEIDMRPVLSIAVSLLEVDKEQTNVRSPRVRLYASILAVISLFAAGFSETFLSADAEGYHLSLFLFVHSVIYMLLALAHSVGSSRDILHRVRVFPTNSISRILFVVWASIRHPFSIALVAGNTLFFIVLYRANGAVIVTTILLYLLLTLNVTVIASVVFLFLEKKNRWARVAKVVVALLGFTSLGYFVIFQADSIMTNIPLVGLCGKGIVSALNGNYSAAMLNAGLLMLFPFVVVALGRRVS